MKNTVSDFFQAKKDGKKLAMLTAYDYATAKLLEKADIDAILVGDSLGNVILGYPDTLSVTMEDMISHTAAVARGAAQTFIVADMPFMSYQVSAKQALKNAGRLVSEGRANAVKLEGGANVCPQISVITKAGIPVMAHLGFTPQSVNAIGKGRVSGKNEKEAKILIDDALAVQEAGAFCLVLECVPESLAKFITGELDIATIGIGAGRFCDGQVLVCQDMLGMSDDFLPKFVKPYAAVGDIMKEAFSRYTAQVKDGSFPAEENCYAMDEDVLKKVAGTKKKRQDGRIGT